MIKKILISLIAIFFTINSYSQHSIKGKVLSTDNEPLMAVTVVLLNPTDSTMELFGVTNQLGDYEIKNIKKGKYLIQYAFVGMQTLYTEVNIPVNEQGIIGNTVMKVNPVSMDEVSVIAEYIPIKIIFSSGSGAVSIHPFFFCWEPVKVACFFRKFLYK